LLRRSDWNITRENKPDKALEAVFGEIYRKHEKALYRLALRVTKSEQQSQDIIQEVFVNAHTLGRTETGNPFYRDGFSIQSEFANGTLSAFIGVHIGYI